MLRGVAGWQIPSARAFQPPPQNTEGRESQSGDDGVSCAILCDRTEAVETSEASLSDLDPLGKEQQLVLLSNFDLKSWVFKELCEAVLPCVASQGKSCCQHCCLP